MGIGILIVVVGSLIYKGRGKMRKILIKYKDKIMKNNENLELGEPTITH